MQMSRQPLKKEDRHTAALPGSQLAGVCSDQGQGYGQVKPNKSPGYGVRLRGENKTVLVEVGDPRSYSDIAGWYGIVRKDDAGVRQDLADRFEDAGCTITRKRMVWLTAGDFSLPTGGKEEDEVEEKFEESLPHI
jgi:hypothetical protein